jgi:hypothetical protein
MTDAAVNSFFDELEKIAAYMSKADRRRRNRRRVGTGLAAAGFLTAAGIYGGPKVKGYVVDLAGKAAKEWEDATYKGIRKAVQAESSRLEKRYNKKGPEILDMAVDRVAARMAEKPGVAVGAAKNKVKDAVKNSPLGSIVQAVRGQV